MATPRPRLRADRPQSAVTQRQQQEATAHVAANPKFNWEAYGDAAVRDIQASGDAGAAGQRKTYFENLERWNRGAQNWGGPKQWSSRTDGPDPQPRSTRRPSASACKADLGNVRNGW
jgi:hypothetical protein